MNDAGFDAFFFQSFQDRFKLRELLLRDRSFRLICASEMRENTFQVKGWNSRQVLNKWQCLAGRYAQPPHAGIDLGMQMQLAQVRVRFFFIQGSHQRIVDRQMDIRFLCILHALRRGISQNHDGQFHAALAQLQCFFNARHPQPGSADSLQVQRDLLQPVPVGVGLYHPHHRHLADFLQLFIIRCNGVQVDFQPGRVIVIVHAP